MVLLCWTCKKICLFLAVLGLCWFGGRERELFSGCRERELLSSGMRISHSSGLSCCGAQALGLPGSRGSVIVTHELGCSVACGIFPDQGLNPYLLHWQVDSLPLSH